VICSPASATASRRRRIPSFRRRPSCAPTCSKCSSAKATSAAIQRGATGKHPQLRIELKYFEGEPAIKHVARVSKPGRRVYSGSKELPRVRNGLGITIVSTPKGVLSDAEARTQNVGGEVLAEVF
jgi:ribosomal protein S8